MAKKSRTSKKRIVESVKKQYNKTKYVSELDKDKLK
jgi:hypothetical protein